MALKKSVVRLKLEPSLLRIFKFHEKHLKIQLWDRFMNENSLTLSSYIVEHVSVFPYRSESPGGAISGHHLGTVSDRRQWWHWCCAIGHHWWPAAWTAYSKRSMIYLFNPKLNSGTIFFKSKSHHGTRETTQLVAHVPSKCDDLRSILRAA